MAKARSPNYPAVTLSEALQAIGPAFQKENRNKMSRLVLARHLGYTSLNGRALGKIGAVRAYGLIEGSGDELRVSGDAITILSAPAGQPEKKAALERCATRPRLFKDLRADFPDTLPSDENLRFNLVQRGFTTEAARKAANTYLATMRLVYEDSGDYDSPEDHEEQTHMQEHVTANPLISAKLGLQRAEFPFPEGMARFEFPNALSPESYSDLEEWVQLVLRRAKRGIKEGD